MKLIENSDERIVFEAKNYIVCTPNGKRLSPSAFTVQLAVLAAIGLALWPGMSLQNYLADVHRIYVFNGVFVLPIAVLIFIALLPFMRSPNPNSISHQYQIRIDKVVNRLFWEGRGWYFYRHWRYSGERRLQSITSIEPHYSDNCHSIRLGINQGTPLYLAVPDENTANQVSQKIEQAVRQIPDNVLAKVEEQLET